MEVPESVCKATRAVLLSNNRGVLLRDFSKDYNSLLGSNFPWRQLGYGSSLEALRAMESCAVVKFDKGDHDYRVFGVAQGHSYISTPLLKAQWSEQKAAILSKPTRPPRKRPGKKMRQQQFTRNGTKQPQSQSQPQPQQSSTRRGGVEGLVVCCRFVGHPGVAWRQQYWKEPLLGKHLQAAGRITEVFTLNNIQLNCGFVHFSTVSEARKAIQMFDHSCYHGADLRVTWATPRPKGQELPRKSEGSHDSHKVSDSSSNHCQSPNVSKRPQGFGGFRRVSPSPMTSQCNPVGKDRQDLTGQDWTDQGSTGKDLTGQGTTGKDLTGQDWTDQGSTGKDLTGQGTTGKDLTGQDLTGQGTTGKDLIGQELNGQDVTGQDWSGQDVTGQDWSGQDWSGQDWSGQDGSGQDRLRHSSIGESTDSNTVSHEEDPEVDEVGETRHGPIEVAVSEVESPSYFFVQTSSTITADLKNLSESIAISNPTPLLGKPVQGNLYCAAVKGSWARIVLNRIVHGIKQVKGTDIDTGRPVAVKMADLHHIPPAHSLPVQQSLALPCSLHGIDSTHIQGWWPPDSQLLWKLTRTKVYAEFLSCPCPPPAACSVRLHLRPRLPSSVGDLLVEQGTFVRHTQPAQGEGLVGASPHGIGQQMQGEGLVGSFPHGLAQQTQGEGLVGGLPHGLELDDNRPTSSPRGDCISSNPPPVSHGQPSRSHDLAFSPCNLETTSQPNTKASLGPLGRLLMALNSS